MGGGLYSLRLASCNSTARAQVDGREVKTRHNAA